MHWTAFDLAQLLHPFEVEAFFRDCWERQPHHIPRSDPDYYGGLLSLRDVDDLIAFTRPKFLEPAAFQPGEPRAHNYVQGFLAGAEPFPAAVYPSVAEVHQAFTRGKTLILASLQHRWAPVATLCRALEGFFTCPAQANLYLTPPGEQGFDPHFDTHEVFILQLAGSKHWRFYGGGRDLPLAEEHGPVPREQLGPLTQEVLLNAGDLLYLPRGHVHEVFTSQSVSMHLTVGVKVFRWVDLLHQAVADLADADVRFRRSLPPGLLTGPLPPAAQACFHELLQAVAQEAHFAQAVDSLASSFLSGLAVLPNGYFAARDGEANIELDTVLERAPGMIGGVAEMDGQVSLVGPGFRLDGPAKIASALHFVARTPRFAVRSLPDDLTESAKLVLARRLVREKFLILSPASAARDREGAGAGPQPFREGPDRGARYGGRKGG